MLRIELESVVCKADLYILVLLFQPLSKIGFSFKNSPELRVSDHSCYINIKVSNLLSNLL